MPLFEYKGHVHAPWQLNDCRIREYHQEKHNRLLHLQNHMQYYEATTLHVVGGTS